MEENETIVDDYAERDKFSHIKVLIEQERRIAYFLSNKGALDIKSADYKRCLHAINTFATLLRPNCTETRKERLAKLRKACTTLIKNRNYEDADIQLDEYFFACLNILQEKGLLLKEFGEDGA